MRSIYHIALSNISYSLWLYITFPAGKISLGVAERNFRNYLCGGLFLSIENRKLKIENSFFPVFSFLLPKYVVNWFYHDPLEVRYGKNTGFDSGFGFAFAGRVRLFTNGSRGYGARYGK
jgi:hypothetical protein